MNPNDHIKDEQILGYIHHTLNDAERETINHHLTNCQFCRSRVSQDEIQSRHISNGIQGEMNGVEIPVGLSFSRITPQLGKHHRSRFWVKLSSATPLVTAILGLFMAAVGFWQTIGEWTSLGVPTNPKSAFPALACFFFMFVSMDQFDRSFSIRPRFILSVLLAILLWSGTFFIGLMNILVITDLVTSGFLIIGGSPETGTFIAILTAFLAAMVFIGVVIGGAEYHYRHIGQPGSWKLFTWTLIIQLFIMILPYFLL